MTRIVNSEVVFVSDVSFETTREIPHLFKEVVEINYIHKEKKIKSKSFGFQKRTNSTELMQLLHVKIFIFRSNFSVFVSQ